MMEEEELPSRISDRQSNTMDTLHYTGSDTLDEYEGYGAEPGDTTADSLNFTEFEVTLDRSAGSKVGWARSGNRITGIKEGGLVKEWNETYPSTAVREGDLIVSVNGIEIEEGEELPTGDVLEITLRREITTAEKSESPLPPPEAQGHKTPDEPVLSFEPPAQKSRATPLRFRAELQRFHDRNWGLTWDVMALDEGRCVVDSVLDNSAAAAYNAEQKFMGRPERCITAGDVLVRVADVIEAAEPEDQDDIDFAESLLTRPPEPESLLQTLMRTATEVVLDFQRQAADTIFAPRAPFARQDGPVIEVMWGRSEYAVAYALIAHQVGSNRWYAIDAGKQLHQKKQKGKAIVAKYPAKVMSGPATTMCDVAGLPSLCEFEFSVAMKTKSGWSPFGPKSFPPVRAFCGMDSTVKRLIKNAPPAGGRSQKGRRPQGGARYVESKYSDSGSEAENSDNGMLLPGQNDTGEVKAQLYVNTGSSRPAEMFSTPQQEADLIGLQPSDFKESEKKKAEPFAKGKEALPKGEAPFPVPVQIGPLKTPSKYGPITLKDRLEFEYKKKLAELEQLRTKELEKKKAEKVEIQWRIKNEANNLLMEDKAKKILNRRKQAGKPVPSFQFTVRMKKTADGPQNWGLVWRVKEKKLGKHVLERIEPSSVLAAFNNEQLHLQTGLVVKEGDELHTVNGRADQTQITRALSKLSDVTLCWNRYGESPTELIAEDEEQEEEQEGDLPEQILEFVVADGGVLGLRLGFDENPPQVLAVDEGTLAKELGARVGDRLLSLNGVSVASIPDNELLATIRQKRPLKVRLLTSGPGGSFDANGNEVVEEEEEEEVNAAEEEEEPQDSEEAQVKEDDDHHREPYADIHRGSYEQGEPMSESQESWQRKKPKKERRFSREGDHDVQFEVEEHEVIKIVLKRGKIGWKRDGDCITSIIPGGKIDSWNQTNPSRAVQQGDRIIEVNGISPEEEEKIAQELQGFDELRILMERPVPAAAEASAEASAALEASHEEAQEYNVVLKRARAKIGWTRDGDCITSVLPGGLIDSWNQANPSKAIQAGDFLVEVNGISAEEEEQIIQELQQSEELQIVIARENATAPQASQEFEVVLQKTPGSKLGWTRDGNCILGIAEGGLVDSWNQANPSSAIQEGDSIVEVNGISAEAEEELIMQELEQSDELQITMARQAVQTAMPEVPQEKVQEVKVQEPQTYEVVLQQTQMGWNRDGNHVVSVRPGGLVDSWNQSNPSRAI
eukprot:gnl/MRDRNA2_/MRDRNA2_63426_c0_seq3.p1 gnl/MRDRNA2_/MRDRNA2_63426_c0~~gnl/MRDRNA2_/MRDRNA2_63426_c0_seq3.p1  ORF type:complete len:1240 (+),score=323.20 gnl/MRDRNA2_/MRDRNA2_63426_c0_seq3:134-3853(+)